MDHRPIGVFDSGMGGISVLAKAIEFLPRERFIYFGDNEYAPYGAKSNELILKRSERIIERFIQQGCKAVVIACNTATSVAAAHLRTYSPIPIIGMEPALKPAAERHPEGTITVLATAVTLRLQKFQRLMSRYGQHTVPISCPCLVEYVEHGETDLSLVENYLRQRLSICDPQAPSAIVLGCTHFYFVKALIAQMYPQAELIDGHEGTIQELARRIELVQDNGLSSAQYELTSSAEDPAVIARMQRLLTLALQHKDYYQ